MLRSFFPSRFVQAADNAFAAFEIAPSFGQKRLFLMAIRGVAPGPMPGGMFEPEEDVPPAMERFAAPAGLPVAESGQNFTGGATYVAQPVRGRVVRDADGTLCELCRNGLRPLGRVVCGARGELLELLPTRQLESRQESAEASVIDAEFVDEAPTAGRKLNEQTAAGPAASAKEPARCRTLFAEPGLPRLLPLGAFKTLLAPQLAHPERLRDVHRLPCNLQVFESTRRQRVEEMFEGIRSDANSERPLQPLTARIAALLGLQEFIVRRPQPDRSVPREPGTVLPFERFFELRVVSDPTADPVAAQKPVTEKLETEQAPPPAPVAVAEPAIPKSTPAAEPAKRCIPESYQKPWEFQFGRDEVLYDINVRRMERHPLRSVWRRVRGWFRSGEEYRKWQALLCGKSLEEQLWAVRPPRGALDDAAVREWAERTLGAAGYEPRTMLLEWEIFWRRKGA